MTSDDPVTKLLDTFYEVKDGASKVVGSTVNSVLDSELLHNLQVVVFGDNAGKVVKWPKAQPPVPRTLKEKATEWVARNKMICGILAVAIIGGAGYSYITYLGGVEATMNKIKGKKRRRARRAGNGARKEVIVLAGSPAEPLTRIIVTDMEKRGFIVFWTTSSAEEEAMVAREKNPDIRPLPIKPTDVGSIEATAKRLSDTLSTPVTAFPGASPHYLKLAGIVVVPDLFFPAGPVESLRVETWSDLMYAKIMGPIILLSNGLLQLARDHQSRVILLTPSIMGELNAGFHAPQAIATNALSSLALCISRELKPQGVPFIHMKLGSFNTSRGRSHGNQAANAIRADILSWSDTVRRLYAKSYQSSSHLQVRTGSGSNIRVLHHSLYDALTEKNPRRVWYVGRGAYTYHLLGKFMPEFMMGFLLHPSRSAPPPPLERDWEHVQ